MRTAALLESGVVVNVIVIEDNENAEKTISQYEAVEITGLDVRIGDLFDGRTFTRVKTDQEIEAETSYVQFLDRRKAIAERLGLSEEEIKDFFGI